MLAPAVIATAVFPWCAVEAQGPKIVPPRACQASPSVLPTSLDYRVQGDRGVRVAVVRFEESISDDARLHLSWAAGEHIANTLRSTPGVSVLSGGTVARAWIDAGAQVASLARLLDADFVVTGRSAMRGSQAEIGVTLWHAKAETSRWDRTFIYPQLSLPEIVDSSVVQIARYLGVDGTPDLGPAPRSTAAYEAIARGDYFLRRPDVLGTDSARAAYERATSADPSSPLAKVRLARTYAVSLARSGRTSRLGPERAIEQGLALTDAALSLDSSLAEAWTVRAMLLRFRDPLRLQAAVQAHERAVALAPSDADAQHEYGETLLMLGQDRAALDRFRRALVAEPSRATTLRAYAELELLGRRFPSSCALLNASIAADQYDPLAYALRAQVRLALGEFRDAYADAEISARLSAERWGEALTTYVHAAAGDLERAKREARQLANTRLRGDGPLAIREARYLAAALAATGDRERAIQALSRARPQGAQLRAALRDPILDGLRSDALFKRLVGEVTGGRAVSTAR